jgi:hypothetical protein
MKRWITLATIRQMNAAAKIAQNTPQSNACQGHMRVNYTSRACHLTANTILEMHG